MNSAASPTPANQARQLFARERLPFPPLPEHLAARLVADGDHVFASRKLEFGPYNLELFLSEVETGDPREYAVVGFDGHGMNSWAAHYYLVQPGLALFLQLPWGGAYDDPDECRRDITQFFDLAGQIQEGVQRDREQGTLSPGGRLVVVSSPFAPSGWAWLPAPAPGPSGLEWHETRDALGEAAAALANLTNGRPNAT
jgi:hypothetical protein